VFLTYILLFYCVNVDENITEDTQHHPGLVNVSFCKKVNLIYDVTNWYIKQKCGHNIHCQNKGKINCFLTSLFTNFKCKLNPTLKLITRLIETCLGYGGLEVKLNNGMSNYQLLVRQGVHPNPGPPGENKNKINLSLITFNCRGLRNKTKFRGLLAKVNKLVSKGAIVALQETHEIEEP
jgi:hypothetical protein